LNLGSFCQINGKALRYGLGVGREDFPSSGAIFVRLSALGLREVVTPTQLGQTLRTGGADH